ncbi:transposase [Tamlana sp. PT2-4]|uniref:Transposase n=2 Tax=Neotamlana laminarinivorans TaxID=2883124 RepID=A0A9X1HZ97_9FLAO|nr:transposase [Tamlana laminarinivorans]
MRSFKLRIATIIFIYLNMETDGYKIRDQSKPHYVTFTVVNWVDVFTRQVYKYILIENLNYCIKEKGMIVFGYVIMSNHLHLIVQSSMNDLSGVIRDFKKYTAKAIINKIKVDRESRREWMLELFSKATESHGRNKAYQFWRYGNHPEEIYSQKFLWSKLDYMHLNPVRAGLVEKASHYKYSSASNYVFGEGELDVSLVDSPVIDVHSNSKFWKSIVW